MILKEAVESAKEYIWQAYADEEVSNLLLEEVVKPYKGNWFVTIGFDLPVPTPDGEVVAPNGLGRIFAPPVLRHYKVVEIDNESGLVAAMRIRELLGA